MPSCRHITKATLSVSQVYLQDVISMGCMDISHATFQPQARKTHFWATLADCEIIGAGVQDCVLIQPRLQWSETGRYHQTSESCRVFWVWLSTICVTSDFATIVGILHQLTQNDQVFQCSEDCNRAFVRPKSALARAPALAYLDPQHSSIVDTDTSREGLGVVLYLCNNMV